MSLAQTKDDLIIKNVIYHFICEEDQFKSHLDCKDIDDLIINDALVVIKEIKVPEMESIKVFFFRRGASPSRAYLLIKQGKEILIIGQNKKDMFEEMKELCISTLTVEKSEVLQKRMHRILNQIFI
ncbi:hypothetical protein [Myroides marinus]|uniref:hypothetical protein n=1 Tax=Myroides marinus TaxID=703342 RepID=UPI002578BDC2|nr:hypothetical protein [Myroides marinus]